MSESLTISLSTFFLFVCAYEKKKKMVGWNAAHLFWDDYLFILRREKKNERKESNNQCRERRREEAVQSILNRPSRSR
jgi:hypothetical protein